MVETVISIRAARLGDEGEIASVHDAAWREAYRGVIPGRELERMIARRGPAWWRLAIARRTPADDDRRDETGPGVDGHRPLATAVICRI